VDSRACITPNEKEPKRFATSVYLLDILRAKVRDIEALELRLARSKTHLLAAINEVETRPDDLDCASNAKRLLSKINPGKPNEAPKRMSKNSRGA
jgi:hypothetical protein